VYWKNGRTIAISGRPSPYPSCSAKYRFKYVLGIPDPAAGGAVRGKAVHKAIEHYLRAKIALSGGRGTVPTAGIKLDVEDVIAEWDHIWDTAAEGAEFAADEDIEALKKSGAVLAEKYLREAAPDIQPVAVEVPVAGEIAGVPVRGIVDILDATGRIIDIKTSSRKPSKMLATYTALLGSEASGETRIDSLVATKDPQLVQIEHVPGVGGERLVRTMYPLAAEGIATGLFLPNRASMLCDYCAYREQCESEYGRTFE
jgi:RecB family exonuclease